MANTSRPLSPTKTLRISICTRGIWTTQKVTMMKLFVFWKSWEHWIRKSRFLSMVTLEFAFKRVRTLKTLEEFSRQGVELQIQPSRETTNGRFGSRRALHCFCTRNFPKNWQRQTRFPKSSSGWAKILT